MPDAQETDVPSIPWRLIELRLKVAALQRAEMLVRDALKRREVIGSTLSKPDRYASMFRRIDETLRELEAGGHGSEESILRLSRSTTCLEHEACELAGEWLQPRKDRADWS